MSLIKLLCPECKSPLNDNLKCENEHQFHKSENVILLTTKVFAEKLNPWLRNFELFRQENRQHYNYQSLPYSGIRLNKNIWRARSNDLRLLNKLIQKEGKLILEIGSWNGWLSNQLSQNHKLVAIDYFIDYHDGLKAKNHYKNSNWESIQMNLDQIDVFQDKFDCIIVNRCTPYFSDLEKTIHQFKNVLKNDGIIVLTGLNVSNKKNFVPKEFSELQSKLSSDFSENISFKEIKPSLNYDDLELLKTSGFTIKLYKSFKNYMKSIFYNKKQVCYYAILENRVNKWG